jgi:hypothetical protein
VLVTPHRFRHRLARESHCLAGEFRGRSVAAKRHCDVTSATGPRGTYTYQRLHAAKGRSPAARRPGVVPGTSGCRVGTRWMHNRVSDQGAQMGQSSTGCEHWLASTFIPCNSATGPGTYQRSMQRKERHPSLPISDIMSTKLRRITLLYNGFRYRSYRGGPLLDDTVNSTLGNHNVMVFCFAISPRLAGE